MYRILFSIAVVLAVFAIAPAEVTAQSSCYICDEHWELCDQVGPAGVNEGCAGDGGTVICRSGECSDACENHVGHCQIVYATLEPFDVTPDEEVIFADDTGDYVALLPLPGHEDLWGRWACAGKLTEVYQQRGDGYERLLFDVSSYRLPLIQ